MNEVETSYLVEEVEQGTRLDRWLLEQLEADDYEVSRSQVQGWIRDGYVKGPHTRTKSSESVETGTVYDICVPQKEPFTIDGDDVPFDIVYVDDDVVVVNKPRGIVVHPGAGHERGTLINGLVKRGIPLTPLGGEMRPGVVHRIDKDTSGLLMLAKTDVAYHRLTEQLRDHTATREYLAIVHDVLVHSEGTIDAPIGRDPNHRQRMGVVETGKPAITQFSVLERFARYTLVRCRLETGRTHQIRAHFAYIGHPLAGDPVYGRRHTLPIEGQALHARTLGFIHPKTGEELVFEAPLPEDMDGLIRQLQQGVLE